MSDLQDLLRESIIREDIRDPDDRARIYAEARRAVVRRLWDNDPPIRLEEIDSRIADFDSKVARIEKDLRAHFDAANGVRLVEAPPRQLPPAGPRRIAAPHRRAAAQAVMEAPVEDSYAAFPEPEGPPDEPPPFAWDTAEPEADGYGEPLEETAETWPHDEAAYDMDAEADYVDAEAEDEGPPPVVFNGTVAYEAEDVRDPDAYDAPLGYEDAGADYADTDEEAYRAPIQADRWSDPGDTAIAPRPAGERPRPKAKKKKRKRKGAGRWQVGLLAGAIGVMLIGLAGFGWFLLNSDSAPAGQNVTVAIEENRQVSDAATAVRIASEEVPVLQTFSVFDGFDPKVFESTANNPVGFENDGDGGYARITSSAANAGARVVISPGLAEQLAGKDIRVRILARESNERGAASMRFAYQSGVAISHWQTASLEPNYAEVAIRWRVPSIRTNLGGDRLVIEPGIPGDGTAVDIRQVEIDILGR